MIKEFNTYLEKMDSEYWSRLCREYGSIKRYRKGEDIILIGTVAKYIGLIKSGSVKYISYNFEMEELEQFLRFSTFVERNVFYSLELCIVT